jgi:hypothetical protein
MRYEIWDKIHSETYKSLQVNIDGLLDHIHKCKEEWMMDCLRDLDPREYRHCVLVYNPFISHQSGGIIYQNRELGHYKVVQDTFYGILGEYNSNKEPYEWIQYPRGRNQDKL